MTLMFKSLRPAWHGEDHPEMIPFFLTINPPHPSHVHQGVSVWMALHHSYAHTSCLFFLFQDSTIRGCLFSGLFISFLISSFNSMWELKGAEHLLYITIFSWLSFYLTFVWRSVCSLLETHHHHHTHFLVDSFQPTFSVNSSPYLLSCYSLYSDRVEGANSFLLISHTFTDCLVL